MTMDAHSPYFIKGRPLDSSRSEGTFRRDHHRLQPLGEGLGLDLNARCTSVSGRCWGRASSQRRPDPADLTGFPGRPAGTAYLLVDPVFP
jgi:hypothetical protein